MSTVNRVERLIINLDTAMPLSCAWDDCPNRARTPYQVRVHEHAGVIRCDDPWYARHAHYAFCGERCKAYWLANTGHAAKDTAARNRGLIYGQLPPGMKRMI
jgi:hypothetical protein